MPEEVTATTMETTLGYKSFFKHAAVVDELLDDLRRVRVNGKPLTMDGLRKRTIDLCEWLGTSLRSATYRANRRYADASEVGSVLASVLHPRPPPNRIKVYQGLDMVIVEGCRREENDDDEEPPPPPPPPASSGEAIVDAACGSAVLKGAHVFAPGVLSVSAGARAGDAVAVFADLSGNCKRGAKGYDAPGKLFLGNGRLRQTRAMLFNSGENASSSASSSEKIADADRARDSFSRPVVECCSGIAVEMSFAVSGLRQLRASASVPPGDRRMLLQNPPSVIAVLLLDPRPGQTILDMCAAPGNKTSHVSSLMNGEGRLVALEKVKSKIQRLRENCEKFGCENVAIHWFDATRAVAPSSLDEDQPHLGLSPPFPESSFHRILLDGPCSGLGQRPQLLNRITPKELRSYVPLQRKLVATAARLLKVGGILVYSTCTVTVAENEGIVAWALRNVPCLKLSTTTPSLVESWGLEGKYCGTRGYCVDGLTEEDSSRLLRFGPGCDTIGFFVARFEKTEIKI